MSISAASTSAGSGLAATARRTEVISGNISNALSEGYARRSVTVQSNQAGSEGSGVSVVRVSREVDENLLQGLRSSLAQEGYEESVFSFLQTTEKVIGAANAEGSFISQISKLESTLVAAAANPASEPSLSNVVTAAQNLSQKIVDIAKNVSTSRQAAENKIAIQVERANKLLLDVSELNIKIAQNNTTTNAKLGLEDQRQLLIDELSSIIPIKQVKEGNGKVSLRTAYGIPLLEGKKPITLSFTPNPAVTADMTLANGRLSSLKINGIAITTSPDGGRLGKGELSALFEIRDIKAPETTRKIDSIARNLIERFRNTNVDPTITAESPGLFTDNGTTITTEVGLAQRLAVNNAVDPKNGGQLWKLRDGLEARTVSATGNASILKAMSQAISDVQLPRSGGFSTPGSFSAIAANFLSYVSTDRVSAETKTAYFGAQSDALRSEFLAGGVNTDSELQDLLLAEQAYAANARVLQKIDDMINTILGI